MGCSPTNYLNPYSVYSQRDSGSNLQVGVVGLAAVRIMHVQYKTDGPQHSNVHTATNVPRLMILANENFICRSLHASLPGTVGIRETGRHFVKYITATDKKQCPTRQCKVRCSRTGEGGKKYGKRLVL